MKKLKVFCDYHHQDLYASFRLLFEKRLGGKIYRPIGYEWADQHYWTYADASRPEVREGIKKQYLEHQTTDGEDMTEKGVQVRADYKHGELDYLLTLDEFMKKDIDIVIASVANHEAPFSRLCQEHPNKPKLIRQAGNVNEIIDYNICKNIMLSCGKLFYEPSKEINQVIYHQEFDLDIYKSVDYYILPPNGAIKSFLNCFPNYMPPSYPPIYYPLYLKYRKELSEYDWKMYGALGKDGVLNSSEAIAEAMQSSTFVWHTKFGGDGFGHCIHNAFAVGRPVITYGHDYQYLNGQLAGLLLEDLVTCIDLDKRDFKENVTVIREYSEDKKYREMCENVRRRFREVVNYDVEEKAIRKFLSNLKCGKV